MNIPNQYLDSMISNELAAEAFANVGFDWREKDVWCIHDSACGDPECCGNFQLPSSCDDCIKIAQTNLILDNPHVEWIRTLVRYGHHVAIVASEDFRRDHLGYYCGGEGCYSSQYPCHYLLVAENAKDKRARKNAS